MDEEETANDCLLLANRLIRACKLPLPVVSSLRSMRSSMFSMMFESIFHIPVPDHIKDPKTAEEEAHNVQAVIDTISLDLLAISLSHITGEDIVSKNVYAVYNLLEIFEGVLLYMSDSPAYDHSIFDRTKESLSLRTASSDSSQATSADDSHVPKLHTGSCGICGYDHRTEHHVFRNEAGPSIIHHDQNSRTSKSDDAFYLDSVEDQRTTTLSRRLSKSLEEVYVPTDDSEISEKIFKASSDSSREIKRKTKKLPVKITDVRLQLPSFTQTQDTGKEKLRGIMPSRRKSLSLEDISIAALHPVVGQENGAREDSVSVSSEDQRTELNMLERQESDITEPQTSAQSSQITRETVDQQYARNLETKIRMYLNENEEQRRKARRMEKTYLKTIRTPIQKKVSSVYKKSYITPSHKRGKSVKGPKGLRTTSSSQLSVKSKESPVKTQKETAFLNELREEFPGMQLTPNTVRRMKQNYGKQLRTMHKNVLEALQRKSRTQLQVEEAAKRQAILSDILRKDTKQEQYRKNMNEHKEFQIRVKAAYREARQQSSRIRSYYEEFHNQMKRRLQQRNTREEVLLKHVFEEGVDIQKEQVRELLRHVKERQEKDAADQKIYLDALENFYQTQLSMVTESLAVERCDLQERLKAQKRVITSLKRDRRNQLKQEVRRLQDDIVRDKDAFHFRELDAELCVDKLRDKYSTRFTRPR